MRRLIQLAARLYPRAWRERYGEEFHALLEDAPASPAQLLNVTGGALKMHGRMGVSYWKLAALLAVLGALIGVVTAWRVPVMYVASAKVTVTVPEFPGHASKPGESQLRAQEWTWDLLDDAVSPQALTYIIHTLHLYPAELSDDPVTEVARKMRHNLQTTPTPAGGVQLGFAYPDAAKARAALSLLADALAERKRQEDALLLKRWRISSGDDAPALDPVRLNVGRISASSVPNLVPALPLPALAGVIFGAAMGLLLAAILAQPRRMLRVAGWAVAGFVVAAAASYFIPSRYRSSATLRISAPMVPERAMLYPTFAKVVQLREHILSDASLAAVANREFEGKLRANHPGEGTAALVEALRRNLTVSETRSELTVSFTDTDREQAQRLVSVIIADLTEWNVHARAGCVQSASNVERRPCGMNLDVLDRPDTPEHPISPNRSLIALFGSVAGLLLGIWRTRRNNPPNSPGSVPTLVPAALS